MTGGRPTARSFPILTVTASGVAVAAAIVQFTVPGASAAMQRDPSALADGQWWRLVTPLLVQTLGWHQVLINLASLAVIGVVAEELLGRARWLALAIAGTIGGQIAAYSWHEPGGGSSIAICGLAGGAVVALLTWRGPLPAPGVHIILCYVVALAGWAYRGAVTAVAACAVAAALLATSRVAGCRGAERIALAVTVPCALVLLAVRDLHGASLTAGMLSSLLWVPAKPSRPRVPQRG